MPKALLLFLSIELIVVSALDLKERKIKNIWSVFNLALFLVLLFLFEDFYPFHFKSFVLPGSLLVLGFGLFALKIAGGGDAKFLPTFFLLVPFHLHESFGSSLIFSTIFVASLVLGYNTLRHIKEVIFCLKTKDFKGLKTYYGSRFAFAPVILLAWTGLVWKEKLLTF